MHYLDANKMHREKARERERERERQRETDRVYTYIGDDSMVLNWNHSVFLDGNYTRLLCAILNKSLKQHSTKLWLFDH